MKHPDGGFHRPDRSDPKSTSTWVPRIDTADVLERLIADELRAGRLTPARRRRILHYAAGMGLSAVQAGRLVIRIRTQVLAEDDPEIRHHALRLVRPVPERIPAHKKIAMAVAAAILLNLLLRSLIL